MEIRYDGTVGIGNPSQNFHRLVVKAPNHSRAGEIVVLGSTASDNNAKQYFNNYGDGMMFPSPSGSNFYFYSRQGGTNYRFIGNGGTFFTGQHVGHPEDYDLKSNLAEYVGLTVCSADTGYRSYNAATKDIVLGNEAISINESLPDIKLSSKSCDSSVIGVISNRVDNNVLNTDGTFEEDDKPNGFENSLFDRIRFNSVGEGALWVTDINGTIQNGDYVTTSNVVGYSMKQSDDILHNYTVAKVTMSCDFNPILQPVRISKKNTKYKDTWVTEEWSEVTEEEYTTPVGTDGLEQLETTETSYTLTSNIEADALSVEYYDLLEDDKKLEYTENVRTVYKRRTEYIEHEKEPVKKESTYIKKEYQECATDELGRTILEDDPDGKMQLPYKIKYLDASGKVADEATHVIKAAFLGCTYHCG
jgi:hypothetical protein